MSKMEQGFAARRGVEDMHVESSMIATGPGFITQSGEPTEEQFNDIRARFGDPRANVKPSDYYTFRMIASGDGLDSYYTKQDVATSFTNFVRDLRHGQSLLGHHETDSFTYGSSYAGEVTPADEQRAEYEPTFYPQWDTPELRTKQWLVGDYYITRGVTLNNQSTDHLVRSMELGGVRKASISFMVGQYVCGIDGQDLIGTMFGPMPDESCMHFPGIAYEGQLAWALMKNNTLVETSLVYKNASPSSMLLRKAEALAQRGSLSARDIEKLEGRFQVRLPRFEQHTFGGIAVPAGTVNNTTSTTGGEYMHVVTTQSDGADTRTLYINGMEVPDMTKRGGGDATARELAREALTAEPEPEQEESPEAEVETQETEPVAEATETDEAAEETVVEGEPEVVEAAAGEAETREVEAEAEEVVEAAAEPESEAAPGVEAEVSEAPAEAEALTEVVEATQSEEVQPKTESTREEDAVAAFVGAADQLASALARNPDAFDTGQLAVAARAERAIDLALIDAGCEITVGGHVARIFETRSKALRDTLGEPLTVEAIRSLQSQATLGETLYEELVKDAVAARTGAQRDGFNAAKYRDLLMSARDVAYVKEEIESWKAAKRDAYSPGRSVVPRQVSDARTSKDERKSLPDAPSALTASKAITAGPSGNILDPRSK